MESTPLPVPLSLCFWFETGCVAQAGLTLVIILLPCHSPGAEILRPSNHAQHSADLLILG